VEGAAGTVEQAAQLCPLQSAGRGVRRDVAACDGLIAACDGLWRDVAACDGLIAACDGLWRDVAGCGGAGRAESPAVQTIYVVDDDPDQAALIAEALAAEGREVRSFSDPIRALASLSTERVHLLVADLSMPWIDGADVVSAAQLRNPALRAILTSGYARGEQLASQRHLPFVPKPIDLGELRRLVAIELEATAQTAPP
jgi:CheY-like chemotaxis protein